MINVIVELSKYIILTLMIVYTFHCFYTVRQPDEEERNELLRQQLMLIFFIDFTAFLVIYLKTFDYKVVRFYIEMQIFFAAIQILYRILYKKASLLLLNNMCMLLSVGFIMLCRLDITMATKQLLDCSRSQWNCTCHTGHDPENAFSAQTDLDICRDWYHTSGSSISPGQDQLRSKADTSGCSAV